MGAAGFGGFHPAEREDSKEETDRASRPSVTSAKNDAVLSALITVRVCVRVCTVQWVCGACQQIDYVWWDKKRKLWDFTSQNHRWIIRQKGKYKIQWHTNENTMISQICIRKVTTTLNWYYEMKTQKCAVKTHHEISSSRRERSSFIYFLHGSSDRLDEC